MPECIIEVTNLSKTFPKEIHAVKDISFHVQRGEFFAFLGPNGAGKSTTIKILTTLLRPSSGHCIVAGFDLMKQPDKIRRKIGVALQTTAIDPLLTGRELLVLQGRLCGFSRLEAMQRAKELLELVNLSQEADRPCGKYSGGMKRRLDLGLTLVHRPELLFLDEPTTGLDPVSRIELWNEIIKLKREYGTTIFLTTQYLEEADKMADRICIMNRGEVAAAASPEELKQSVAHLFPSQAEAANPTLEEVFVHVTRHQKSS